MVSELYGERAIVQIPRPTMSAEDLAHLLQVPSGHAAQIRHCLQCGNKLPLHDSRVDVAEERLAPAAQLMAGVIKSHLKAEAVKAAAAT